MLAWNAIRRLIGRNSDEAQQRQPVIEWPRIRVTTATTAASSNSEDGGSSDRRRRQNPMTRLTARSRSDEASTNLEAATNITMPLLYSLARSWAWEAVIFRCQTHPHEASNVHRDYLGDTCLHWTVFGRPPLRAVQAILTACPETASTANDAGLYPLHVACSYRASLEVIQAVCNAHPEAAVSPSKQGVCPIHLLCDYGGNSAEEALKALLSCAQGMESVLFVDPRFNRRPLYILNERKNLREQQEHTELLRNRRLRQREIRSELMSIQSSADTAINTAVESADVWQERYGLQLELLGRLEDDIRPLHSTVFWKTVVLLIVAEYQHILAAEDVTVDDRDLAVVPASLSMPPCMLLELDDAEITDDSEQSAQRQSTILHTCVGNPDCPPSLQEYAILLYEPHLATVDARGNCPLHLAASQYAMNGGEGAAPQLMQSVIVGCPQAAAVRNGNGRLPLSLALQRPSDIRRRRLDEAHTRRGAAPSVLDQLIDAHPLALLEADVGLLQDDDTCTTKSSIYPHLFARLSKSAIYTLLQANPNMVLQSLNL